MSVKLVQYDRYPITRSPGLFDLEHAAIKEPPQKPDAPQRHRPVKISLKREGDSRIGATIKVIITGLCYERINTYRF